MSKEFKIAVSLAELRLDRTLQNGQSFRWSEIEPGKWRGVLGRQVWTFRQDEKYLYCEVNDDEDSHPQQKRKAKPKNSDSDLKQKVEQYFRLDVSLRDLYRTWSQKDSVFKKVSQGLEGVRLLQQDPLETVFSFICSSNNNITRITKLVDLLSDEYGDLLATIDGREWNSFPTLDKLAKEGTEQRLRHLGFGYRAKSIEKSANFIIQEGGETWLRALKNLDYRSCHEELLKLSGVGPKVADCICLMSLNHLDSIPVDIHIFQISARDYLPHLKNKSITPKIYNEIGDCFRDIFGSEAGWAHSVLFTADLKKFKKPSINKPKKRKSSDENNEN